MKTKYKIDLLCVFCNVKCGEHFVSSEFGFTGQETPEQLGFVDTRCSLHEQMYGSFKAMAEDVVKVFGDPMEAEEFVKTHKTVAEVAVQLSKDDRFIDTPVTFDTPFFNETKDVQQQKLDKATEKSDAEQA